MSVAGELTVYTSRNPQLLKPLLDDYSREMSVAVSYVRLRPEDVISQPVNPKAYPPRIVAKWGKYRQDQGNLGGAGRFAEQAANLMERAGYR